MRVQWDPERTPSLGVLPYRSIQIGISGKLNKTWSEEWIESTEDVTEKAQALKKTVDAKKQTTLEELIELGLVPEEKVYDVPTDLRFFRWT